MGDTTTTITMEAAVVATTTMGVEIMVNITVIHIKIEIINIKKSKINHKNTFACVINCIRAIPYDYKITFKKLCALSSCS